MASCCQKPCWSLTVPWCKSLDAFVLWLKFHCSHKPKFLPKENETEESLSRETGDEKEEVRERKKGKLVSYLQWEEFRNRDARARENEQMNIHTPERFLQS